MLSSPWFLRSVGLMGLLGLTSSTGADAQDLVPGAYTPAPVGINIVTVTSQFNNGDLTFDPSLPIEDGHATIGAAALGFSRTLNLAGRSATIGVGGPYVRGHVEGRQLSQLQEASRSGLGDLSARISLNLYGAPAMTRQQFAGYHASTNLGVSIAVGVPTGQYNPGQVINLGTNRWSIKPEVGISRTRGRWTFEAEVGASVFTDNTNFVNGQTRQQAPIASTQGHLIYTIRPGLWAAGDGNFWHGGRLTNDGVASAAEQTNSRLGITLAVPIGRQQVRVAYSFGAYSSLGGDFQSLGVSYSYAWTGRP